MLKTDNDTSSMTKMSSDEPIGRQRLKWHYLFQRQYKHDAVNASYRGHCKYQISSIARKYHRIIRFLSEVMMWRTCLKHLSSIAGKSEI